MKILHITASYKPAFVYGGPIFSISTLCEQLFQKNHEVSIYSTTANGIHELPIETGKPVFQDGVRVLYFPRVTTDHSHFSPRLLLHLWKTVSQYDAVHIHSWWNLVSVLSLTICLFKGVTPIVSPRGMLSDYTLNNSRAKKLFHRFIGARILNKAKLHATTEAESCELIKRIPGATVMVAYNLTPLTSIVSKKYPGNVLKLVFLSRIDPKKGIEVLFEALSTISLPFHLTIAGHGDHEYINRLKQLANDLNLTNHITWHGPVSGPEKFRMLSENDVTVLTSYNENFANVVIESLSAGTPVLISEAVGLADYVRKNKLGWVSSLESRQVAGHLNAIYSNRHILQGMAHRASDQIQKDFNHELLVNEYIKIYTRI